MDHDRCCVFIIYMARIMSPVQQSPTKQGIPFTHGWGLLVPVRADIASEIYLVLFRRIQVILCDTSLTPLLFLSRVVAFNSN